MRRVQFWIVTVWVAASLGCASAGSRRPADLVILDARVWTGSGASAEAIAVTGERISAVGSSREVRRWIGPSTRVIEAAGKRVIPGLTDCHIHIVSGGQQLSRLALRDVGSRQEFVEAVAAAAGAAAPGQWLQGGRWSVESWVEPSRPRKEWIDSVTPTTPVFLSRMDGHQGLANSIALGLAGIDAEGPGDPPGGVIERDPETGEPSGILKDAAMDLVYQHIPPATEEMKLAALLRAMKHLNAMGITSVHDLSGASDLGVLVRAWREGALTVRIRKFLSVSNWPEAIETVKHFEVNDEWLRVAGFKGYMDGSMGSRTAYMYRPFADADPDATYPSGLLSDIATPPKNLRFMIERADAAGLQCAVHAIGDEANHILLDAYAAVARKNGPRDRRHRAEHAQHLLPEDIPRFGELGVIASMQPYHKADDGRYAEIALGADRLQGSYAYRSLMNAGALVCFGSDWPVVTANPFLGMWAAVTSKTLAGNVWIPSESITIEEALRAYTVSAAFAGMSEDDLGKIQVGKLADMVILSWDILDVPADRIGETKALMTIVGGRIVYEAPVPSR